MESSDHIDQGRLDLVPMIDCVMLLLLFFILTTHFRSEDQHLAALLPTDAGGVTTRPAVLPPPTVSITVTAGAPGEVMVRIGGNEAVVLRSGGLRGRGGPELEALVDGFHRQLAAILATYEQPGTRSQQVPVEIACATRLPWSCAMAVYDAVRGYEHGRQGGDAPPIDAQRAVAFVAPPIRDSDEDYRAR